MAAISEVLAGVSFTPLRGAASAMEVAALEFNSRAVVEGALFFCIPGTAVDGHSYAADAVRRGACALVVERELDVDVPQILVADSREALSAASANFYRHPSRDLRLVGITGTNGKTTTTFLVEHMAAVAGEQTGLMGTVECHIRNVVVPSLHTTPESRDLQDLLGRMRDEAVDVCAMEVSSHAIDLGRINNTHFAVAAFTNLTQDHLDYHQTMERYFNAKAALFTAHSVGRRVVCIDNEYGARLSQMCRDVELDVLTVGFAEAADIHVVAAEYSPASTALTLAFGAEEVAFTLPLTGKFNVENALVAAGIGRALGYRIDTIVDALSTCCPPPGRLQRVVGERGRVPEFGVLVDYAHTADSIEKAVAAVKAVTPGRVICVFGCGGDRDASKRPKMGAAALTADFAVVTSDNPRTENPRKIIDQILPGMAGQEERFHVEVDRAAAIKFAIQMAQPGDAVLIAGKGHEDYQIVGTTKHHFDDREIAAKEIEACA